MSRSRIIVFVAFPVWPTVAFSQNMTGINPYIKPIISKIAKDPNVGGWTWETNCNGGYLLRMAMDVTGDGKPELFVSTSLTTSKYMAEWMVFDVNASGELHAYNGTLRFPADSVWPASDAEASGLMYIAPPDRELQKDNEENSYPAYHFSFSFPAISQHLTYVSEKEANAPRFSDASKRPKLQAISLADYLTKPESEWSEVSEWKMDRNDCFYLVNDKEKMAENVSFTPQVALSLLGESSIRTPKSSSQSDAQKTKNKITSEASLAENTANHSHQNGGILAGLAVIALALSTIYLAKKRARRK